MSWKTRLAWLTPPTLMPMGPLIQMAAAEAARRAKMGDRAAGKPEHHLAATIERAAIRRTWAALAAGVAEPTVLEVKSTTVARSDLWASTAIPPIFSTPSVSFPG